MKNETCVNFIKNLTVFSHRISIKAVNEGDVQYSTTIHLKRSKQCIVLNIPKEVFHYSLFRYKTKNQIDLASLFKNKLCLQIDLQGSVTKSTTMGFLMRPEYVLSVTKLKIKRLVEPVPIQVQAWDQILHQDNSYGPHRRSSLSDLQTPTIDQERRRKSTSDVHQDTDLTDFWISLAKKPNKMDRTEDLKRLIVYFKK
ncbi:hypothetical protein BD560DRAFT_415130 [Blakeslea trispora]|nr:hypothetical protein BD560DRAFT_415130 [Blakeslea trispora]